MLTLKTYYKIGKQSGNGGTRTRNTMLFKHVLYAIGATFPGTPSWTLTNDRPLRRRLLYTTELSGHIRRAGIEPAIQLPCRGVITI